MQMAAGGQTFLFTDLVGFTALTAAQGDDRAAEVALDFYRRVRPLLSTHRAPLRSIKSLAGLRPLGAGT